MTALARGRAEARRHDTWGARLLLALEAPDALTLLALFVGFVVVWAAIMTITEAPMGLKHDMTEAYAWGQEFQFGYNQHPPFWAWMCGSWFRLFPSQPWAFALLSSVNAGIGLFGARVLLGNFVEGRKRAASWLLLLATPFYTMHAYKYDANIIFISLWPWLLHMFLRAVRSDQRRYALGFGIMAGLSLMSKYYALIPLATCVLALPQLPGWRRYMGSLSPYLSVAVAALICVPHVVWLLTHRAPPIHYLEQISGESWATVASYARNTALGVLGENAFVIGIVLLALWLERRSRRTAAASSPAARTSTGGPIAAASRRERLARLWLLATLTLAPVALTFLGAAILRTRTTPEMLIGMFPLVPLLVIEVAGVRDNGRLFRMSALVTAIMTVGMLLISPAIAYERAFLSPAGMKEMPLQEVAVAATKLWHARTGLPVRYVAGTAWYENATAFYSPDHPHSFVMFDYRRNLWVTPARLARHGLLSICVATDASCMTSTRRFMTPASTQVRISVARRFWGHMARPVPFVITIIPPRG